MMNKLKYRNIFFAFHVLLQTFVCSGVFAAFNNNQMAANNPPSAFSNSLDGNAGLYMNPIQNNPNIFYAQQNHFSNPVVQQNPNAGQESSRSKKRHRYDYYRDYYNKDRRHNHNNSVHRTFIPYRVLGIASRPCRPLCSRHRIRALEQEQRRLQRNILRLRQIEQRYHNQNSQQQKQEPQQRHHHQNPQQQEQRHHQQRRKEQKTEFKQEQRRAKKIKVKTKSFLKPKTKEKVKKHKYQCKLRLNGKPCNGNYKQKGSLIIHLLTKAHQDQPSVRCNMCNHGLYGESSMKGHIKNTHYILESLSSHYTVVGRPGVNRLLQEWNY